MRVRHLNAVGKAVGAGTVPQPRPRYAPAGTHRCPECNALVPDGDECDCVRRREVNARQEERASLSIMSSYCGWYEMTKRQYARRKKERESKGR